MIQFFHVSFFVLCLLASLSKNLTVWRVPVSAAGLARLRVLDKVTAAAAGLLTITGLAMVFGLAKQTSFYLSDPQFWAKMALFIVASALVIWTKVDFKQAAKTGTPWTPPWRVRAILAFDFIGLLVLASIGRRLATGGA